MSKSIRNRHNKNGCYVKFFGGDSDKKDKVASNKKFRRRNKMDAKLSTLTLEDMFKHHSIRDVSDVWNFRSDGLANYVNKNGTKYSQRSFEDDEWTKYKSK